MEPGTVRSEDDLVRPSAPDRLDDIVESSHPRGVAIYVGVVYKLINDLLVCTPVISETAEMRDDEIHVAVFRCEHFDNRWLPGDIYEKRKAEGPCRLANLAGRHGLMAMNLNPAKPHSLTARSIIDMMRPWSRLAWTNAKPMRRSG